MARKRKPTLTKSRMRLHAMSIAVICGVILLLFAFVGPKQQPAVASEEIVTGNRFISIDSATWGRNCDPYMDEAIRTWRMPDAGKKGPPKPAYAQTDNALPALRRLCDHRMRCTIQATSEKLGVEPLDTCFKRLSIGYRCFTYDRLKLMDISQNETFTLDCHEKAGN